MEQVILVDEQDRPVGTMEKLEAHRKGLLHRAFSIFVFDDEGRLLMQQRAADKYHCGGLWTNTCCSHPRPEEDVNAALQRKLMQEMGFSCGLRPVFSFIYQAPLENGLIEHELDHIFFGEWQGTPEPNPAEVQAWEWISMDEIEEKLHANPEQFTPWFRMLIYRIRSEYERS